MPGHLGRGRRGRGSRTSARRGRRRRSGAGRAVPSSDSSSARATRQLRMSPGGSTPRSRRRRPDEPPSSATVTIAVMSSGARLSAAQQRREPGAAAEGGDAREAVHVRRRRGRRALGAVDVAVRGADVRSRAYRRGQHLGDGHAAVPPAGAADADHHAGLALLGVGRQQEVEERLEAVQELVHPGGAGHVLRHAGVEAGERAAGRGRSGGCAGSGRRRAGRRRGARRACSRRRRTRRASADAPRAAMQGLGDPAAQVPDRQAGGVDDHVGALAHVGELGPRSRAMPSATVPPTESGCGRRVSRKRLMSASSEASRKTTRGRTPRRRLDALEHRLEVRNQTPPRTSQTTAARSTREPSSSTRSAKAGQQPRAAGCRRRTSRRPRTCPSPGSSRRRSCR